MKKRKIYLIILPLILGITIYLLYRSRNLFYFKLFKTSPLIHDFIIDIRKYAWLYRKHFPLWVVYSLPDGLWLFSFGATLLMDRIFYFFHFSLFTGVYLFMIFLEFIQKIFGGHGTKLGTFDVHDILCFTLGYVSIVLISNFFYKRENIDKKEITLKNKKKEVLWDIKIIIIFTILGTLPSLL